MSRQFFSGLKQTRVTDDRATQDVSDPEVCRPQAVCQPQARVWTVAQKARVLTEGAALGGLALTVYLKRQEVSREEYERWRQALLEDSRPSPALQYRMDRLKRTLARQQRLLEKAGVAPSTAARRRRRLRRAQAQPPGAADAGARPSLESDRESARSARGRPRKFNPAIPAHIDQSQLPKGIYWRRSGRGNWYVFVTDPDTGERNTKVVAGPRRACRCCVRSWACGRETTCVERWAG